MNRFLRITALAGVVCPAAIGVAQVPTGEMTDCATVDHGPMGLDIIQHTADCVINWDTFSIGDGFTVSFNQQDSSWRVLNRVTGQEFSTIAGTLTAPGTVYIVNPAGIYFTGTAFVDVGGIYAAAGSMTDQDFLTSVDRFTGLDGEVVNEGTIFGNIVHMVGRRVVNDGTIRVDGAVTMVAAANEVLISETGGRIMVRVDGTDLARDLAVSPGDVPPTLTGQAAVENTGTIIASGGQVVLGAGDLYSLAIRNAGQINASGGSAQLAALAGTVVHGGPGGSMIAGDVAMTGDVLFLDGDVNAQTARFNDPVVLGSDVAIGGAGAASIVFASTVDSEVGETNDLFVNATSTTVDGDIGSRDRLDRLELTGEAALAGDVRTAGNVIFGGDARILGDVIAGDDAEFQGRANVDGNVTAFDDVRFNADAVVGGNVTAQGDDAVFFGTADVGGNVTAFDDVRFHADAIVGGNVTAQGDDALFFGTADVGGNVTAFDDAEFFGDATVGGDVRAQGLDPTAGNVIFFATADIGGNVTAADDVEFFGDAVVSGHVTALNNDVTFFGTADVGGNVTAFDDIDFNGDATVELSVRSLTDDVVFRATSRIGQNVAAADRVQFDGDAEVHGDVTTFGGDVLFMARAAVDGSVTAADDVRFIGDAVVGGDVTAQGDDVFFFGTAEVDGSITAFDDVEFSGDAVVGGDVTAQGLDPSSGNVIFSGHAVLGGNVTASDDVTFEAAVTLNGAGTQQDQRVQAGAELTLGGSLAKLTNGSLTLIGAEKINLNGPLISAIDDIFLNPDGRTNVPETATIGPSIDPADPGAALHTVSIVSQAGSIMMGPNEKMTVLGDLHLEAARSITVGDLNSLGDMHVTAPEIFLRTRASGLVLSFQGSLDADRGLDLVTNGRFFFSVTPQLLAGGAAATFGSRNTDADALATLGAFNFNLLLDLGPGIFTLGETVLDLRAEGFSPANLAEALGGRPLLPVEGVDEEIVLSPQAAARLAALGIEVRPLRAGEERSGLAGRYFYNDAFTARGRPLAYGPVAINRLSRSATIAAMTRFDELFDIPDGRGLLGAAWRDYAAGTDEPGGAGFRQYLEVATDRYRALDYLNALRGILEQIRISGLSAPEFAVAREAILDRSTPPAVTRKQLRQAIEG